MPVWLNTTLLGLGTVFFGLVCLIFIAKLMSALVRAGQKEVIPQPGQAPAAPAAKQTIPNRGEFVAAIACAIATTMGTEVSGLRIHSIKKIS